MTIEFKLPELGENIETADIVKILVAEGDNVKVDQILFEIETDKATVEVPSEVEGVITKVLAKEGTTVKVGDVLFLIETDSEEKSVQPEKTPVAEQSEQPSETKEPATATSRDS